MAKFNQGLSLAEKMKRKKGKNTTKLEKVVDVDTPKTVASNETVTTDISLDETRDANTDPSVVLLDMDLIDIEEQVRREFDQDFIEDLACDFALSPNNQPNQPVTVWTRPNGRYLLDDGENRYRGMDFAAKNRKQLGIKDLTAFTTIRATVRGAEGNKLDRVQSQAKANLLRNQLTDVEIGNAARLYLEENPEATHTDVAKWLGFQKEGSARVKISNALKLLNNCDQDLINLVKVGDLGARKALKIQDERNTEQRDIKRLETQAINNPNIEAPESVESTEEIVESKAAKPKKSEKTLKKAVSRKKTTTVNIDVEALKTAAQLIHLLTDMHDIECTELEDEMDRKKLNSLFQTETLKEILDKIQ